MQLVHVSNMKLNAQMFSSRCLSIHRRILIRNFLTMLYQQHPIDWIEESPVDDRDQWLEQTLSAAGIGHSDALAQVRTVVSLLMLRMEQAVPFRPS